MKNLLKILVCLSLVLLVSHVDAQDKLKASVRAYGDFAEPWRSKLITAWENRMDQLEAFVKENRALDRRLATLAGVELARMKRAKNPWILKLDPRISTWSAGDFGYYPSSLLLSQVIPPSHLLMLNKGTEDYLMVEVQSTGSLTEGGAYAGSLSALFYVTGTTTYTTVAGSSKTVMAVELHLIDRLKKP